MEKNLGRKRNLNALGVSSLFPLCAVAVKRPGLKGSLRLAK